MKLRITILFLILYTSAFKGFLLDLLSVEKQISSTILLGEDLLVMVIGLSLLKGTSKRYIYSIFFLLLICLINYFNNDQANVALYLSGVREVSNVLLFLIIFHGIFKSDGRAYFEKSFHWFVWIFLISQIPVSIYQYIINNSTSGDWVGGTLGSGGSGVLTITILLMIIYKVQSKDSYRQQIAIFMACLVFLIPTLLNETKITFILFPLMLFTLIRFKHKLLPIFIAFIGTIFLFVFGDFYNQFKGDSYTADFQEVYTSDFLQEYLAGQDVTVEDIARFTKLGIGTRLLAEDHKLLFGEDIAAFKGGSTTEKSEFGSQFEWLLVGSRPYLFYLLITGGIALAVLIIYMLLKELFENSSFNEVASSPVKLFLIFLIIILLFYNDSLRSNFFQIVFVSIIFFSKKSRSAEV